MSQERGNVYQQAHSQGGPAPQGSGCRGSVYSISFIVQLVPVPATQPQSEMGSLRAPAQVMVKAARRVISEAYLQKTVFSSGTKTCLL